MLYPKATLAGLGAAVVSGVSATIVEGFFVRRRNASQSGGVGAVSTGLAWFAPAALVGFVVGFTVRRHRAR